MVYDHFYEFLNSDLKHTDNCRIDDIKDEFNSYITINQTCDLDNSISGKEMYTTCQKLKKQ